MRFSLTTALLVLGLLGAPAFSADTVQLAQSFSGTLCEVQYTVGTHAKPLKHGTTAEAWCPTDNNTTWLVLGGSCSYKHESGDKTFRMAIGSFKPIGRPQGKVTQHGWLCTAPVTIDTSKIVDEQLEARAICGRMCPGLSPEPVK